MTPDAAPSPGGDAGPRPRTRIAADGVRLALTTLTVLPVRAGRVDRAAAAVAMGVAPLVGALLGLVLAGILAALATAGAPHLVAVPWLA